uniref:Retrovirus-related Pol polyprotein from transposon TNT 1-94-like beta-barrel domain-containing protein n=1 Tax=Tanacetum cinerariifolium TaxID=118510 RepID=A0A699HU01_TANCI|nr:hypothetical protein [Tanacetum cinerariifolium]
MGMSKDNPHQTLKGKCIVDSGCSRHMTRNKAYLVDYQDFNSGHVAFGVLLRVPRQHNMYSFNLENIVPSGGLACLIAKTTVDESTKWHRRVAEEKNRTLIEAARTMLPDLFLPNTFWAESVSTACYVLNRVLVTKPQNKTPYELLTGKFKEKSDEGFLVGYSLSSKAFRPITTENKANKTAGPKEANTSAGTQDNLDAGNSEMEADYAQEYYVLLLWSSYTLTVKSSKANNRDEKLNEDTDSKTNKEPVALEHQAFLEELERLKTQEKEANNAAETLRKMFTQINAASTPLNTASIPSNQDDSRIPSLEDIYEVSRDGIFTCASYND